MIHTYDKTYLEIARTSLGRMLDFAELDDQKSETKNMVNYAKKKSVNVVNVL